MQRELKLESNATPQPPRWHEVAYWIVWVVMASIAAALVLISLNGGH